MSNFDMSDSDEEDIINYYQYRRRRKEKRKHWVHPYLRNNANFRLFVTAKELSESDRKTKEWVRVRY